MAQGRRHQPKIGHGRVPANNELLDYGELNLHALGPGKVLEEEWTSAGLTLPDRPTIRRYRMERVREQLRHNDVDAILLYDPLNIRYATDTTNMSLWTTHNQVRYCFIPVEGPVILFEFSHGEFLDTHSEVVDEIRPCTSFLYFYTGSRSEEIAKKWATEIIQLLRESGGGDMRLAVDSLELEGIRALESGGVRLVSGMPMMEDARTIKCDEEIDAMRCAAHACMASIDDMRTIFEPGVTELALFARLQEGNVRRYGEWIETRLLASGPRTNPWYQEASSRVVQAGDLMGFDTDMIGAYGACIDISRTWLCGGGKPSGQQRSTYGLAMEQLDRNIALHTAGTSFRELTEKAWYPSLEEYNCYTVLSHGVGLCDEYPSIYTRELWDQTGYDGVLEPGMVMCVESFVGPKRGGEGVKLEQQILITNGAPEQLAPYSLDLD